MKSVYEFQCQVPMVTNSKSTMNRFENHTLDQYCSSFVVRRIIRYDFRSFSFLSPFIWNQNFSVRFISKANVENVRKHFETVMSFNMHFHYETESYICCECKHITYSKPLQCQCLICHMPYMQCAMLSTMCNVNCGSSYNCWLYRFNSCCSRFSLDFSVSFLFILVECHYTNERDRLWCAMKL